jgi:peptidoglycan/xylan/chitin deacetylase (PgdA/CDA1 family)
VYLTIDDGWYPNDKVLDLMRSEHLPITTFLVSQAAANDPEHLAFWKRFVAAGGIVQNHTVSHPWLTKVSPGDVEAQWAGASAAFTNWFGFRPTLGRPPYGAVDDAVWQAAANAGLEELVMWSAVDNGHGLQTWNKGPLAPGAIVLMHWDPGLFGELRQVLAACEAQGLLPKALPTTI